MARRALLAGLLASAGCGRIGFAAHDDAGGIVNDGADAAIDSAFPGANRAFVTSTQYTGNLGGLAGADQLCEDRANAGHLGGSFVAMLWSGGASPAARLAGSRGWVDLTGRPIADDPAMWTTVTYVPLQIDELGVRDRQRIAWFGSATFDCGAWTDGVNNAAPAVRGSDPLHDYGTTGQCGLPSSLMCVERGHNVVVAPPQVAARMVFVTTSPWPPGGGLAAADATCMAAGAGFGRAFKAFLTSGGVEAGARFADGTPFERPDGVLLAPTATAFLDPTTPPFLDTFLIQADGTLGMTQAAWTGTTDDCTGWTDSSSGVLGGVGAPFTTDKTRVRDGRQYSCNIGFVPLICAEP
jgi:hypothetical protein